MQNVSDEESSVIISIYPSYDCVVSQSSSQSQTVTNRIPENQGLNPKMKG